VNVDACSAGDVALDKATRQGFHIVISDHHMPGMTGLELLARLRSQKSTARIGFILISGSMNKAVLGDAQKWGLNNFLPKPFDTAKLKACLETVTGKL
jgi:two-component system chemotaxis response regulator CheY